MPTGAEDDGGCCGVKRGQFTAYEPNEHVGDYGTCRSDWMETALDKAGVPGNGRWGLDEFAQIPVLHRPSL